MILNEIKPGMLITIRSIMNSSYWITGLVLIKQMQYIKIVVAKIGEFYYSPGEMVWLDIQDLDRKGYEIRTIH